LFSYNGDVYSSNKKQSWNQIIILNVFINIFKSMGIGKVIQGKDGA